MVVKDAGELTSPFTFAFLRFAVAAVAFSPFLLKAIRDPLVTKAGLELGFWTAAGYLLQAMGLLSTDASRASFLSTFTVLVVPFLSGMKGERVSPVTLACAAAAVVGVGLLEQTGAEPGIGDVWSFLSAVAFGVQVFRTEHWARLLQQADADDVSVEGSSQSTLPLMSVVLFTTMVLSAAAGEMRGGSGGECGAQLCFRSFLFLALKQALHSGPNSARDADAPAASAPPSPHPLPQR